MPADTSGGFRGRGWVVVATIVVGRVVIGRGKEVLRRWQHPEPEREAVSCRRLVARVRVRPAAAEASWERRSWAMLSETAAAQVL